MGGPDNRFRRLRLALWKSYPSIKGSRPLPWQSNDLGRLSRSSSATDPNRSKLKRARHQLLHDLGGAGVDAVHAGVRIGARDRILEHVAVAAEQLQAGVEHLVVELGEPPLAHGGGGGVELALEEQ